MQKLMVAALSSGAGKTSVSMGLAALFRQAGKSVQVYKTGPDYIDPQFYAPITGRRCINLDPYFLCESELIETFSRYQGEADILLVEAAMGLTDGIAGQGDRASALQVARPLSLPILLLVARGSEEEAAEKLSALTAEDRARIRGLVLNEGGKGVAEPGTELPRELAGIPVLGRIPALGAQTLKSRHLGLVVPLEAEEILGFARRMAAALKEALPDDFFFGGGAAETPFRVGIARDEAFSFFYEENLRVLRELGCEPVFFSPLRERALPAGLSGLWLPGGYPELYAEALENQTSLLEDIRDAVQGGLPTVAECGGFMFLLESLEDVNGLTHEMVGALPGRAFRTEKLQRFGYIEIKAKEDTLLLKAGESLRGHEFHYWDASENGESCLATKANGSKSWDCVQGSATLFAGYPHIYLANEAGQWAAARFAAACRAFQRAREAARC